VEAAQRFLESKERYPAGSKGWARATAMAFNMLKLEECAEVAKPECWSDEGLKALSARVVRAAPNHSGATSMRADVLSGLGDAWEAGPRSAAELKEAATHWDPSVCGAVRCAARRRVRTLLADLAKWCRGQAAAM
jgi:ABC-type Fe3+ transport system substrate-binding protein